VYLAFVGALAAGCASDTTEAGAYEWDLPPGFPAPRVPEDNPMTEAKVELGRRLFYDVRLSGNETQSCGTCHRPELAFTDGVARATGSTGQLHPRGSMSLANIGYAATLTWANPLLRNLEEQALVPMFGEEPVELGLAGRKEEMLDRFRADADMRERFATAFPEADEPISVDAITKALASFQRTLISGSSPYDKAQRGEPAPAFDAAAERGMELFFSERFECFHCHGGFNLASAVDHQGNRFDQASFHNNGLYHLDSEGSYPRGNEGLYDITGDPADKGKFKAPTLRNIALTAPYMHDGSIETLSEVLDHYAAGGRHVETGPHAGDGRNNPNKSSFVLGFPMTPEEKSDLLAFLDSLTDREFIENPTFQPPAGD
jgi:cytochrome c peroxidase